MDGERGGVISDNARLVEHGLIPRAIGVAGQTKVSSPIHACTRQGEMEIPESTLREKAYVRHAASKAYLARTRHKLRRQLHTTVCG